MNPFDVERCHAKDLGQLARSLLPDEVCEERPELLLYLLEREEGAPVCWAICKQCYDRLCQRLGTAWFDHMRRLEKSVRVCWGMACPACGSDEDIEIVMTGWGKLSYDGTEIEADHEWWDSSNAHCTRCGFAGTVRNMKVEKSNEEFERMQQRFQGAADA